MYLSRVWINDEKRESRRLLSSPEHLHSAVEQCFLGERQRRLWRIDHLRGQVCLLVLSQTAPDFYKLVSEYGFPDRTPGWESKDYNGLLNRLEENQIWHFRLKANPVISVVQQGGGRGKVMAHVTPQQQKAWLKQRAQAAGFLLDEQGFEVVHTQWHRFEKNSGQVVSLRTASFEGRLQICHVQNLITTLTEGLGRAKAYGCGLMTLAKAVPNSDG